MNRMKSLGLALVITLTGAMAGCGDDEGADNYILAWDNAWDSLVEGSIAQLSVDLANPVDEKDYVDVTNSQKEYAESDDILVYQPGEQSKQVTIRAQKAYNGPITLTFTLRSSQRSRDFVFSVNPAQY